MAFNDCSVVSSGHSTIFRNINIITNTFSISDKSASLPPPKISLDPLPQIYTHRMMQLTVITMKTSSVI
jgi:hypothetical protein